MTDSKTTDKKYVAVRLDDEVVARVDALLPHLSRPGMRATRSDALRMLLMRALADVEKDPVEFVERCRVMPPA